MTTLRELGGMAATMLPALILCGEVSDDPHAALTGWAKALAVDSAVGLL